MLGWDIELLRLVEGHPQAESSEGDTCSLPTGFDRV